MKYRWVLLFLLPLLLVSLVIVFSSTSGSIFWKIEKGNVLVNYTLDKFCSDGRGNQCDGTVVSIYRRGFDRLGYYDISEVEWQTTGTEGRFMWVIPTIGVAKAPETYYYAKIYRGDLLNEERVALVNSDTRKTMVDVLSVSAGSFRFVTSGSVPTEVTR